tara:strand:- start:2472 stop:2999 length:528 start_codon:yes stop_codon:yes gene_type:complete
MLILQLPLEQTINICTRLKPRYTFLLCNTCTEFVEIGRTFLLPFHQTRLQVAMHAIYNTPNTRSMYNNKNSTYRLVATNEGILCTEEVHGTTLMPYFFASACNSWRDVKKAFDVTGHRTRWLLLYKCHITGSVKMHRKGSVLYITDDKHYMFMLDTDYVSVLLDAVHAGMKVVEF